MGFLKQCQLVLARRPAARSKPASEAVRQQFGWMVRRSRNDMRRHGSSGKPWSRVRRGATTKWTIHRSLRYSVTGCSEICQSLPSKMEMWSLFIGE